MTCPDYLADLIQEYKPSQNLRSSSKLNLASSSVSTSSFGQRSFRYALPHLWINLPHHIKESKTLGQSKSSLKTHLFAICFVMNDIVKCNFFVVCFVLYVLSALYKHGCIIIYSLSTPGHSR